MFFVLGTLVIRASQRLATREPTARVIFVTDINFKSSVCRDVESGRSTACLSESASRNSFADMRSGLAKHLGTKYDAAVKDVSVRMQAAKPGQPCTP